ncbi:MAG: inositol monophosphatase [Verrucomicrobia bacterium]|nr:inositol monophosphatase [Verrucomicrobiota bacterium]
MNASETRRAFAVAVKAARAAGALMRRHLGSAKIVNEATQHDIKLELDVRCQKLIERTLRAAFPALPILGEEGVLGDTNAPARWVVDPIDGTVNFTYGIPHACVSIALQISGQRSAASGQRRGSTQDYDTILGVVYDPFLDELWTAVRGQPARLNGRKIHVSNRRHLREAIVALGFAKYTTTLNKMLPIFNALVPRVRKIRLLGAAALSMTWVAAGRLDAYQEYGVRLWDVAAGGLIVECAGGDYRYQALPGEHTCAILVSNGHLRGPLERAVRSRSRSS